MKTSNELTRSLSDTDLRIMVREALLWRSKGGLLGEALRGFSKRLELEAGILTDDTLQIAECLVLAEAARRFSIQ